MNSNDTGRPDARATSFPFFTNAEAAEYWFSFGFAVIPIVPSTKRPAALWDPWLKDLSVEKIKHHWYHNPHHEIGFILDDFILILDCDTPESLAVLYEKEREFGISCNLIVKTRRGEHHYYRREADTFAKADSHSTADHPDRIDVKTGRALGILPPSTDKIPLVHAAKNVGDLTKATQDFIDAVFAHNGRDAPRKVSPSPSAIRLKGAPTPRLDSSEIACKLPPLQAMLEHIDPDCGYEDWLHVLMAIYHETEGSEDGLELADAWSRRGTKYPDEREIRIKWNSFDNFDGTPVTIATIRKMLTDQGIDWIDVCAATERDFEEAETVVVHADSAENTAKKTATSVLAKYSLRGMSGELEKQIATQGYAVPNLALTGQITVFYAAPNTGKTLLTLHGLIASITSGQIDANRVYYVNADDSHTGLTHKVRITEEYGLHMLAEGHRDFRASLLSRILADVMANGHAPGTVLVLDTLKKFTDPMDKGKASTFTNQIRSFVMHGGTAILLGHTNKNRGRDGKAVYGGTSDIVDDADCAYIIDVIDSSDPAVKIVGFENIKRRGDNVVRAHFQYSQEPNQSYEALLASVQAVDESQLLNVRQEAALQADSSVIAAVTAAIGEGITTKMKLVDAAAERAGVSKRAVLKVIDKYSGTDPRQHHWQYKVKERGAKAYALLQHPSQAED